MHCLTSKGLSATAQRAELIAKLLHVAYDRAATREERELARKKALEVVAGRLSYASNVHARGSAYEQAPCQNFSGYNPLADELSRSMEASHGLAPASSKRGKKAPMG